MAESHSSRMSKRITRWHRISISITRTITSQCPWGTQEAVIRISWATKIRQLQQCLTRRPSPIIRAAKCTIHSTIHRLFHQSRQGALFRPKASIMDSACIWSTRYILVRLRCRPCYNRRKDIESSVKIINQDRCNIRWLPQIPAKIVSMVVLFRSMVDKCRCPTIIASTMRSVPFLSPVISISLLATSSSSSTFSSTCNNSSSIAFCKASYSRPTSIVWLQPMEEVTPSFNFFITIRWSMHQPRTNSRIICTLCSFSSISKLSRRLMLMRGTCEGRTHMSLSELWARYPLRMHMLRTATNSSLATETTQVWSEMPLSSEAGGSKFSPSTLCSISNGIQSVMVSSLHGSVIQTLACEKRVQWARNR